MENEKSPADPSGQIVSARVSSPGTTNLERLLARVRQTGAFSEPPGASSNQDSSASIREQWEAIPDRLLRRVDFPWFLRQQ